MRQVSSCLVFEGPKIRHTNGKLPTSLKSLLGKTRHGTPLNREETIWCDLETHVGLAVNLFSQSL